MLTYDAQEVALALCDSGVAIAEEARDLVNPTPRDPEQARKVLTANNIPPLYLVAIRRSPYT